MHDTLEPTAAEEEDNNDFLQTFHSGNCIRRRRDEEVLRPLFCYHHTIIILLNDDRNRKCEREGPEQNSYLMARITGRASLAADGRSGGRTVSFSISPSAAATPTLDWTGFVV